MSRLTLPFELPADHLRITRWEDPVVDALGHDPRSPYVERFWLALLGPSTTLLVRLLATGLEAHPGGFDLHLEDTARALGLGMRGGANGPFYRALARTGQFHISRAAGPGALAVRTRIQTLTHHQTGRLPAPLQDEHAAWVAAERATPDVAQRQRRARRLALSLLELGETPEATERQLHQWRFHPAMAHEAMRWARERHTGEPAPMGPAVAVAPVAPVAPVGPAPQTREGRGDPIVAPPLPSPGVAASRMAAAAANGRPPLPRIPPPPRRPRPVFDPTDDPAGNPTGDAA